MDKDEVWSSVLEILLAETSEDDPKRVFLDMLNPLGGYGDQYILLTATEQVETWVRNNYLNEIRAALLAVTGIDYTVNITIPDTPAAAPQPQPAAAPQQQPAYAPQPEQQPAQPDWMAAYNTPPSEPQSYQPPAQYQQQPAQQQRSQGDNIIRSRKGKEALFSKCTFETFVVGKSNEFARNAALAVAEQPGISYNPLFIYGNSGLGKTHLLVAIANYISQNFPNMDICYVSANDFLNDYVEATRQDMWAPFNNKYHHSDVLLIDDIQYLEGKDETINQMFNIFNEMHNQNKQIVLSADRAPKDIDMDERMRSRFIQGLLADVKPPDYETRLAILKNCCARANQATGFNGEISDEVFAYLAESSTSNIREMEGAVTRLISNMTLSHRFDITVEEAKEVLQDFFPDNQNKQISISVIQAEVERFFKVSHEDMISSKRQKGLTYPRHIAIYLSRFLTDESLESIGKKFGGRDHTTIMHSVSKIERDQQDNRVLYDQLDTLTTRIKERS